MSLIVVLVITMRRLLGLGCSRILNCFRCEGTAVEFSVRRDLANE